MVTFGYGCNYTLPGEDQLDTNKLFGIGYFFNHHKESARFGWYYYEGKIHINAYLYINGKRIIDELCILPIGHKGDLSLIIENSFYTFKVNIHGNGIVLAEKSYPFTHKKKWSYYLGIYFGGNRPAPQTMNIEITNL